MTQIRIPGRQAETGTNRKDTQWGHNAGCDRPGDKQGHVTWG